MDILDNIELLAWIGLNQWSHIMFELFLIEKDLLMQPSSPKEKIWCSAIDFWPVKLESDSGRKCLKWLAFHFILEISGPLGLSSIIGNKQYRPQSEMNSVGNTAVKSNSRHNFMLHTIMAGSILYLFLISSYFHKISWQELLVHWLYTSYLWIKLERPNSERICQTNSFPSILNDWTIISERLLHDYPKRRLY